MESSELWRDSTKRSGSVQEEKLELLRNFLGRGDLYSREASEEGASLAFQ